jgi:hypothetical protein
MEAKRCKVIEINFFKDKAMNDPSLSEQATTPDQSVVAADQAQPSMSQDNQRGVLLDADREVGGNQLQGEPANAPIATNFSSATAVGDAKLAGASGEMGAFSGNQQSAETGSVQLQNNPDVPSDRQDSLEGVLPDTDPMVLPNNPETNLPD